MKQFLLSALLFYSLTFFGQSITLDTIRYANGNPNITVKFFRSDNDFHNEWTYYYENGQKSIFEINDSVNPTMKLIDGWLPDGKQILKNGNGIYISVFMDSSVCIVKDSACNGLTKIYKRYNSCDKGWITQYWKLLGTGNCFNGTRSGKWEYFDLNGFKSATVNYEKDTVRGACIVYFPQSEKIRDSGTIDNCLKTGLWKSFDDSGNLIYECNYFNGDKKGEFISYFPDGKVKSKGQYTQVCKKFKMAAEDPKHPGDFNRIHTTILLDNVPAKTGIWFFYNENGDLIRSKKYRNEIETPEYLVPLKLRKQILYQKTHVLFVGIPDCNYY
jgi:antitoxin component YwqK of YwqJK toxin-antitoxin module